MKVYLETYGCTKNKADSEIIKHELLKKHKLVDLENAEIVIINSCAVKLTTENKILYRLRKLTQLNKRIIVAGCMANTLQDKILKISPQISFLGPSIPQKINIILNELKNKKRAEMLSSTPEDKLKYFSPSKRIVGIIPIAEGCVNSCSFCITKKARKNLVSFKKDAIIHSIKKSIESGSKELWLCAEDTGCYGFDQNYNLADLLKEIDKINCKFKVRVGMMNPNNTIKILDELMDAYNSEKIYKFLHIPVQSGSNRVLKDMLRNYVVEDFKKIIKEFRKKYPQITIATDIIAGFPTETNKDFKKTRKLLKKVKPDITNLSRYSPRPGTSAKKLYSEIDSKEVKRRTRLLTCDIKKIAFSQNKKWINWQGEVLISEKGQKGHLQARNFAYKPIILKKGKLGQFKNTRVTEAHETYLLGEQIPQ